MTEAVRQRALEIAHDVAGVDGVRDQIVVDSSAARSQPSVAEARAMSGQQTSAPPSAAWITTKIQSQYFLDPLVKGHEIDVDTQRGVVTLTGTVASEELRKVQS